MEAVEEDSQDEAVEEALREEKTSAEERVLAVAVDQLLVTTMELQDTILGTVRTPLPLVTTANIMIILQRSALP